VRAADPPRRAFDCDLGECREHDRLEHESLAHLQSRDSDRDRPRMQAH
jgi:hypothetical protein